MSMVDITVGGKSYAVSCADGQEEHLARMAAMVGSRVEKLARSGHPPDEARLLLLAALTLADELAESRETQEKLREQADGREQAAARAVSLAADRVEAVAGRIDKT